jgi:hypothetical protein
MIGISIASCVGLALILKYGKPTKSIRDYFKNRVEGLFECSLCLGFWAGVIHCITLLLIVAIRLANNATIRVSCSIMACGYYYIRYRDDRDILKRED